MLAPVIAGADGSAESPAAAERAAREAERRDRRLHLVQGRSRTLTVTPPEHRPAERFARGEIEDEEYRRRSAVLRGDGPSLRKT